MLVMVNTSNNNNNGGNMNNKKTNWNYLYSQIPMWYEDELVGEDVEETIEKQGYVSTDPYYQNEKSKQ